jgi:hypothetical protein
MSLRAKEHFIRETGGFRIGESPEQFLKRQKGIKELRDKVTVKGRRLTEGEQSQRYDLLGRPSDEWDHEASDD